MPGPVMLRGIARRVPGANAEVAERAEASPPILERVVFVSDERDVEPVVRYHRALAIELDDGERVRVEIPDGGAIDFESAPEERSGAWSELRDTPSARGFHADAVPPFARVSLRIHALREGEPVAVWGEELAEGFAADAPGGMREAAARTRVLRARVVAGGEECVARAERMVAKLTTPAQRPAGRARRKPRQLGPHGVRDTTEEPLTLQVWIGAAAALVAVLAVAFFRRSDPPVLAFLAVAPGLALLVHSVPRRPVAVFRAGDRGARSGPFRLMAGMLAAPAWITMVVLEDWLTTQLELGIFAGVVAAVLALSTILDDEVHYRRLANLLRARPHPEGTERVGVWGASEGIVRDPTPVRVGGVESAVGIEEKYRKGMGSDPDVLEGKKLSVAGSFVVETAAGGTIEVDPRETVWATTVWNDRPAGDSFGSYTSYEVIPVGGRVLVAGKLVRGKAIPLQLRSEGTSPALVLATGAHGDPRSFARRQVWTRRIRIALELALAVAAFVLAAR